MQKASMQNLYLKTIRQVISRFPAVVPHLKGRARWMVFSVIKPPETFDNTLYSSIRRFKVEMATSGLDETKTYDYFLSNIERLIRSVYAGNLGGEFVDIMASLISGQLTQAFEQAWKDEGDGGDLPDFLTSPLEDMILGQYEHVDQFYRDIVDARVDETPIDPLLARAPLWAQRWTEAYNTAVALIIKEFGGNMIWELGETEEHCESCAALNSIVARASEWDELGVHPQGAPNSVLVCGGWHCDCRLSPTDKRRSPDAYGRIMNAVTR